MNSKKRYQILIPALSIDRDVHPINDKDISYTWDKQDDKIFYEKKLKNTLMFGNDPKNSVDDFDFFYAIESNATNRCYDIYLNIYKKCDGVDILEFDAKFSLNDCEWDLDHCKMSVKPPSNSIYNCLKNQKNKEVNILALSNIITTKANLDYNYEYHVCSTNFTSCTLPGPNTSTWDLFYQKVPQDYTGEFSSPNQFAVDVYSLKVYYREFMVTACVGGVPAPHPGTGWFLEVNNCSLNGTAKYVRAAAAGAFPPIATNNIYQGWYNNILGSDELPPNPSYFKQTVTIVPNSEDLFTNCPTIYFIQNIGVSVSYYVSVLNNPNSTYVWSLDGASPIPATVSGTSNVCTITPTTNLNGTLIVKLTETHGNGHISTKTYNFIHKTITATSVIPSVDTITNWSMLAPTKVCKNQTGLVFIAPILPTATLATVTSYNWTISGTATIVSGQGTNAIVVNAGSSAFTVTYTTTISYTTGTASLLLTFTTSQYVDIGIVPNTNPIIGIKEVYPTEPYSCYMYYNPNATSIDWYLNAGTLSATTLGYVQTVSGTASATPGDNAIIVKEHLNCGCNFIKFASSTNTPSGTPWIKFPPVYWCYNSNTAAISYTRGRLFKEACEYVLSQLNCGFTQIHSDFFDWNAIGDAPGYAPGINYVTGTASKLLHLTISQKSDVLNPTSSNPATKGMLTFDKMTKIWLELFNCYWWVDSLGRFRVEHESYFNNVLAYDSTVAPHASFNLKKRAYTYNKEEMPKFERFSFSEALYTDFAGTDIWYDSVCVNQEAEKNVKERGTKDFLTTDLYSLFIDPSAANKMGFVLFCNVFDGTNYAVDVDTGKLSGTLIANVALSWANLHDSFHKYGRVLKQGYMNGVLTNFVTAKKNKLQKGIVVKSCCDKVFDPTMSEIKSELGNGIVSSAEENTTQGKITLNLLFD